MKLGRAIYSVAFWTLVAILVIGALTQLLGLTGWTGVPFVVAYCVALYYLIRRHYGRGGHWGYILGFGIGALLTLRLVCLAPLGFKLRDYVREVGAPLTEEQADAFVVQVQSRSFVSPEYLGSLFRPEMWPILGASLILLVSVGIGQSRWINGFRARRTNGR